MRVGKCKRCGNCCKGSPLVEGTEKEIIEYLISMGLRRKEAKMQVRRLREYNCEHLKFEGKKAVCDNYENRPWFCRKYPAEPKDLIPGCGFAFVEMENERPANS